ncbi:GNAT family N-acetyltransferase [Mesobacillus maritimus]|uniref:GNAT family N-acetyltransferase n=1 Tax=Mesobacillus maritimus TaxID=1643336 RepID=UPI00203B0BA6|nr:GNAT family N-acetyltransferase [Mesobacillus maritimus]MCM3585742.1 GNAT family N-acetyltransferase [Mesobacillus maritimus]MCM3670497.1 GNAT family N-acetyltransferase [Mesobacillus maritimus]
MFLNAKIETDRLILRPLIEEDVVPIFKMATEPNHFTYQPDTPPADVTEIENMVQWSKNCNQKNTPEKIYKFNLAFVLKETLETIGIGGLGPHDIDPQEIEIYYGIQEAFQERGFTSEAAEAILNYGFNTIGLKKVIATVHPENTASKRIIEKLGKNDCKILSGLTGENSAFNSYLLYTLVKSE